MYKRQELLCVTSAAGAEAEAAFSRLSKMKLPPNTTLDVYKRQTLQSVAQSRVSAKRAGLLCAIIPTVAAQLGVIVLHEILGIRVVIGLILILISIALPLSLIHI